MDKRTWTALKVMSPLRTFEQGSIFQSYSTQVESPIQFTFHRLNSKGMKWNLSAIYMMNDEAKSIARTL